MSKPSLYLFTDYRAYLAARIEWERLHAQFSYAKFAERAGFQSRSYLRTVVTGKRNLSVEAVAKVIQGFGLSFGEGEAFKALVHYNQAQDFQTRKHYWECFLKCRPKAEKSQRVNDEYLYLARMAYPILLILLRQPHIKKDSESLAQMTGLSLSDVTEGLETLKKLGAITEPSPGQFVVMADGFVTTNDVPNIAIQTFHNNMLEKAQSMLSLNPLEREFQSMMVPLTKEEFLYLRGRIRSLVDEVDQKFGGKRPQSEKVYALNMNLIPVTPELIREAQKPASQRSDEVTVQENVS